MVGIALKRIACVVKDSFGTDSDEPYVIVFVASLANTHLSIGDGNLPVIGARSTLYGPFDQEQSMDGGDVRTLHNPDLCWGINGHPHDISNPQDVIILVGLLESDHDAAFANHVRNIAHGLTYAALTGYVAAGMDRATIVQRLRSDMQGGLDTGRRTGVEHDERLGAVQELRILPEDLANAPISVVEKQLVFTNPQRDFDYRLTFTFAPRSVSAVALWNADTAYFFVDWTYYRYDVAADSVVPDYPKPIAGNWPGLWPYGVDAALVWPNGKAYFFKGAQYIRYDIATDTIDPGYPRPIAAGWRGVWPDGFDTAVVWDNGKAYFFKGDKYLRYDVATNRADPGYPKRIVDAWQGLWPDHIDAAVVWNNGKAYFFKGVQYIRYDIAADAADPGYPRPITGGWPGL